MRRLESHDLTFKPSLQVAEIIFCTQTDEGNFHSFDFLSRRIYPNHTVI